MRGEPKPKPRPPPEPKPPETPPGARGAAAAAPPAPAGAPAAQAALFFPGPTGEGVESPLTMSMDVGRLLLFAEGVERRWLLSGEEEAEVPEAEVAAVRP